MKRNAAFWITLARSVLAVALGLALILQPEKTRPMLVNFMGMFWLMAGVMSLRWAQVANERSELRSWRASSGLLPGRWCWPASSSSMCWATRSSM